MPPPDPHNVAPLPQSLPCTAMQIPGLPNAWWQETTARYDYATDPSLCPVCGGVGLPWAGWFHCDGTCHAIAIIRTGQVFVPVTCRPLPEEMRG
mgnify:FL=1